MADWPATAIPGILQKAHIGCSITSTNTKGVYAPVFNTANYTGTLLIDPFTWSSIGHHRSLIDIAIGASSSEIIVVNNLYFWCTYAFQATQFHIPILIQKGQKVSARYQSTITSYPDCNLQISLLPSLNPWSTDGYATCDTYGASLGSTYGTFVDPGGSANTKGSWVEFCASTPREYRAIVLITGGYNYSTRTFTNWYFDVGLGDTPGDNIIISNYYLVTHNVYDYPMPQSIGPILTTIPVGSKISIRTQCSETSSNRNIDFVLYCFK